MGGSLPDDRQPQPEIDLTTASPARMYDFYLRGSHNYPIDRETARQSLSVVPHGQDVAHANRECEDGAAMRMVAEMLTTSGVDIRMPKYADGRRLNIVNAQRARSEITVEEGYVLWDYWPWSGPHTDPADITGLVVHLVGAGQQRTVAPVGSQWHLKLKSIVGRDLDARGLHVALEVFEDFVAYDVAADISVTNPGRPERGRVCVSDEGSVMWEYRYDMSTETRAVVDTITPVLTNGIGGCRACHTG
jgi:hypothetical protein